MHISPIQPNSNSGRLPSLPPTPLDAGFLNSTVWQTPADSASLQSDSTGEPEDLQQAFHDFVGQTFFGEMIKSFRSTQQPSKYFHGGRAEEIFQGQFDQVLTEKLSDASAAKIADPMFELFMMKRS